MTAVSWKPWQGMCAGFRDWIRMVRGAEVPSQEDPSQDIPPQEDPDQAGTNSEGSSGSGLRAAGFLVLAGICVILVFQVMILCTGFVIIWLLVRKKREE